MGPSERVELKVKGIKKLEFDKAALELALTKPCHRFSKAIDTLIRCVSRSSLSFFHLSFKLLRCEGKNRSTVAALSPEWLLLVDITVKTSLLFKKYKHFQTVIWRRWSATRWSGRMASPICLPMIAANRPSPNSSSPSIPVRTCRFGYTRVDTVVPRVSALSLALSRVTCTRHSKLFCYSKRPSPHRPCNIWQAHLGGVWRAGQSAPNRIAHHTQSARVRIAIDAFSVWRCRRGLFLSV